VSQAQGCSTHHLDQNLRLDSEGVQVMWQVIIMAVAGRVLHIVNASASSFVIFPIT
jgi:hypothetical protein